MPDFFSVETIFFTVPGFGYPMSYLEFFGVVTGAVAVWLSARANVWSWPLSLVGIVLSFFLFFQVQLYPDTFLQVFFFVTSLIGWWEWTHPAPREADQKQELRITYTPRRVLLLAGGGAAVATAALGALAQRLHTWLPLVFSKPSAFPYLDSFTTVLSIAATFLLMRKKVESWYVWLLADVVLTYVYFLKGIKFVGVEYGVFCAVAAYGAYHWTREFRGYAMPPVAPRPQSSR